MIEATIAELGYEPEGDDADAPQPEQGSSRHAEHLSTCSPRQPGSA